MTDLTTLLTEAARAYEAVCAIEDQLEQHFAASGDFNGLGHLLRGKQNREVAEWYRWRLTMEPGDHTDAPPTDTDTPPTCLPRLGANT